MGGIGRPHRALAGVEVLCRGAKPVRIRIDHSGRCVTHAGGVPQRVVETLVLQLNERPWTTAERVAAEISLDEGEWAQEAESRAVGVECLDGLSRLSGRVGGEPYPAGDLLAQRRVLRATHDGHAGLVRSGQLSRAGAVGDDENRFRTPFAKLPDPAGCPGKDAADENDLASANELRAALGKPGGRVCR